MRRPEKLHARLTQVRRFIVQSDSVFLKLYLLGKSKRQTLEMGTQAKLPSIDFCVRRQGPNIPMIGQSATQKRLFRIEAFGHSRYTLIEAAGLMIFEFSAVRTWPVCLFRLRRLQEVLVAAFQAYQRDDLAA